MTNSPPPFTLASPGFLQTILMLEEKSDPKPQPALRLPFRLDGHLYAPNEVRLFDQDLFFYLNDLLIEAGQLRAFASKSALRNYLMDTEQLPGDFEQPLDQVQPNHFPRSSPAFRHIPADMAPAVYVNTGHPRCNMHSLTSHHRTLICFSRPCFTGNMLVIARNTHLTDVRAFWPQKIASVLEI